MCVCVFRRDVTGQRHAAPLQADGLPGRPAAPHGGSRRQEGGLALVGCDAQGTTIGPPDRRCTARTCVNYSLLQSYNPADFVQTHTHHIIHHVGL